MIIRPTVVGPLDWSKQWFDFAMFFAERLEGAL